jgi:hypothetical protein
VDQYCNVYISALIEAELVEPGDARIPDGYRSSSGDDGPTFVVSAPEKTLGASPVFRQGNYGTWVEVPDDFGPARVLEPGDYLRLLARLPREQIPGYARAELDRLAR